MTILSENIKYLRNKKGVTQQELAEKVNYASPSAVQKWESGIAEPRFGTLRRLATYFNVLSDDLANIDMRRRDAEDIHNIPNVVELPETTRIPIIGTIACGTPVLAEQNFQGFTEAPVKNADFALICKGESMINAGIHDGDIVYIKKVSEVENGKIAAVLIDNEATLKRVYRFPDRLLLQPANPAYPDQVYTEVNDVRILGLAVAYTAYIK